MNTFVGPRPYAEPEAAARKLMEIANAFEAVQDGRIFIESTGRSSTIIKAARVQWRYRQVDVRFCP
jgi:hypothetical protein